MDEELENETSSSDLDALLAEFEAGRNADPEPEIENDNFTTSDDVGAPSEPVESERSELLSPGSDRHSDDRLNQLWDYAQMQERKQAAAQIEADVQYSANFLSEEVSNGLQRKVPSRLLKAAIIERYHYDSEFAATFNNRVSSPSKWKLALQKLGSQIVSEFSPDDGDEIDVKASRDREAVLKSVRTSTSAPKPAKPTDPTEGMNSDQFLAHYRGLGYTS